VSETRDRIRLGSEELEDMLAGAPRDPGPVAPGLLGWTREGAPGVCSHCAGRIMARGFGTTFQGWTPIFEPAPFEGCALRGCRGKP
jgi:hypothetical protein